MELSKTNIKNSLALIFFGLLMLLINISFNLNLGGVSINLNITYIIGVIMILIASLKIRDCFKNAKILFYVSIGALVFLFVPLLNIAIANDIKADVEYLALLVNRLGDNTVNNGTIDYIDINEMLLILGSITGSLIGILTISTISELLPTATLIYFIGELIVEICDVRNLKYGDKVKRNARLSIIFLAITNILTILVVWIMISGFGNISFTSDGAFENSGGLGTIGFGTFLVLPLLAIAICYLVFFIKLLISVNRVMNENNNNPDTAEVNYHDDIIDNM